MKRDFAAAQVNAAFKRVPLRHRRKGRESMANGRSATANRFRKAQKDPEKAWQKGSRNQGCRGARLCYIPPQFTDIKGR
jgi:hypothetical protein